MLIDGWVAATVLAKWGVYAFSLVAAGGAWFALCQPALPLPTRRALDRLTIAAAALGALATLARLAVQAGYLIDDGWRGALDPAMLGLAAEGPLGASSALRVAGLALVATLVVPRRGAAWTAAAGAVLVAASFALTGHAQERPEAALPWLLGAHVAAASFWIGALWPLHRACGPAGSSAEAATAAERFGRQAAGAVAALLVAGTALAWTLVGSVGALVGTGYGRALLLKVALVAALLALAAANKWRLAPALGAADAAVAGRAARALRRSIRAEAVAVAAALLATAALTGATALPVQ